MKDDKLIHLVDTSADLLAHAAVELSNMDPNGHQVIHRIRHAQGGMVAASAESPRVAGGATYSDPTARDALRRKDRALVDERTLVRLVARIEGAAQQLVALIAAYPPPHEPNAADLRAVEAENRDLGPHCQNCARVEGPSGAPAWSPIHPNLEGPTDVGGRLSKPEVLCKWCWERTGAWGRKPNKHELERHHSGQKVPWPDDVPKPA